MSRQVRQNLNMYNHEEAPTSQLLRIRFIISVLLASGTVICLGPAVMDFAISFSCTVSGIFLSHHPAFQGHPGGRCLRCHWPLSGYTVAESLVRSKHPPCCKLGKGPFGDPLVSCSNKSRETGLDSCLQFVRIRKPYCTGEVRRTIERKKVSVS